MYIVTIAARISQISVASEARNALAAPWKRICTDAGTPSSRSVPSIARTASPSETPRARLNDTVAAGNWPRWLMTSGALRSTTRAIEESGTCAAAVAPAAVLAVAVADAVTPGIGDVAAAAAEAEGTGT